MSVELTLEERRLYRLRVAGAIRSIETQYGTQDVLDVVNVVDGEAYILPLRAVLRKKLQQLHLAIGEEFGVVNKGKVKHYYDYAINRWNTWSQRLEKTAE